MTAKEKAKELVEKYLNMNDGLIQEFIPIPIEGAKQCALIAVDEIIAISSLTKIVYTESTNNSISEYTEHYYWQQVKEEINKL
jgi:glutathione synthase/RimK-type ligase-like ATP-grasp enzyme